MEGPLKCVNRTEGSQVITPRNEHVMVEKASLKNFQIRLKLDCAKLKRALKLVRKSVRNLLVYAIGHCALRLKAKLVRQRCISNFFTVCGGIDDTETVEHILYRCPAIQKHRSYSVIAYQEFSLAEHHYLLHFIFLNFISWFSMQHQMPILVSACFVI